jgi:mono/diheme cytochrome c family protein
MEENLKRLCFLAVAAACAGSASAAFAADPAQIERGKYLVTIGSCIDCHGHALSGSDVGFGLPGLGTFVGRNLTPDKETGIGGWTDDEIIKAFTTGVRPDGRILAPIMPWRNLSHLSQEDARAIVAYLRSLPAVKHAVPGPFGPKEVPSTRVMTIIPGEVYAKLPPPPQ